MLFVLQYHPDFGVVFFMRGIFLISKLAVLAGVVFGLAAPVPVVAEDEPLRILYVTGGGWHDFEAQKGILTEGIGERMDVEFEINHEAGDDPTAVPGIFADPDFVEGYDLVLYNMSLSREQKPETAQAIIDSHVKHGVPAALLHGSTHSYRHTGNENWFKFLGARSPRHEGHRPFANEVLEAEHPVMQGFPDPWEQPQGELYVIEEMFPTATPLARAYGEETEEFHTTIWVNEYEGVRLFVTTIGHHNETMETDVYLDLVSRGIQWAVGGE